MNVPQTEETLVKLLSVLEGNYDAQGAPKRDAAAIRSALKVLTRNVERRREGQ